MFFHDQRLGLRFMRALFFMSISDVLQFVTLLKTRSQIRMCEILTMFISLWITCAGFVHLVRDAL